jgi:hypothetical protein
MSLPFERGGRAPAVTGPIQRAHHRNAPPNPGPSQSREEKKYQGAKIAKRRRKRGAKFD